MKSSNAFGLIPPYDLDVERAILCSCLKDPNAITKVMNRLDDKSFYEYRNQLIYDTILSLHLRGIPIDILIVAKELQHKELLDKVGGQQYIVNLSMELATSVHAEFYAKMGQEYAVRRSIILYSQDMIEKMMKIGKDEALKDVIVDYLNTLSAKANLVGSDRVAILQEIYMEVIIEYEEATKNPLGRVSWDIGFDAIDRLYDGLKAGDLMMVVAPSGCGKSDFIFNCALNLSRQISVAIQELEMSLRSVVTRLVAIENNIDSRFIRRGRAELTPIFYHKGFERHPILIDDKTGLTALDIRAKLTRHIAQHNVRVCLIDHKDIMLFHTKNKSDVDNWRAITQELKRTAKELKIAIILLAQPTLEGLRKGKVSGSDIRNGGYEDADIILSLFRENYQKSYIETEPLVVTAWKVREGTPGKVELKYQTHSGRMFQDDGIVATPLPDIDTDTKQFDETPF